MVLVGRWRPAKTGLCTPLGPRYFGSRVSSLLTASPHPGAALSCLELDGVERRREAVWSEGHMRSNRMWVFLGEERWQLRSGNEKSSCGRAVVAGCGTIGGGRSGARSPLVTRWVPRSMTIDAHLRNHLVRGCLLELGCGRWLVLVRPVPWPS